MSTPGRRLFVIERDCPLPADEAWRRMTAWERHTATVPFTRITVLTPPPDGVGTAFVARTGIGRLGFDDPMRVTRWEPPARDAPGRCRLEKTGRIVTGWAEIEVRRQGVGSRVRWREELRVWRLPPALDGLTAFAGRAVFGRVVGILLRP
jgi:hypothetical protein